MIDGTDEPEEWRPIPGYEGLYDASSLGRIRSLPRPPGHRGPKVVRVLKLQANLNGRLAVVLSKDNVQKRRMVHHLVAEAFIGSRPPGQETRHLDDDFLNNRRTNLAYGDHPANEQDKIRNGRNDRIMRTECRKGQRYTKENTLWYGGVRICKTCKFAQSAAWKKANPEKAREAQRAASRRQRATRIDAALSTR